MSETEGRERSHQAPGDSTRPSPLGCLLEDLFAGMGGAVYEHRARGVERVVPAGGEDPVLRLGGGVPQGSESLSLLDVVHPQDQERVQAVLEAAIAERHPYQLEYRVGESGSARTVCDLGRPVFSGEELVRFEGVVYLVPEHVSALRELEEAKTRARRYHAAILELATTAARADGDLADVAHQLNVAVSDALDVDRVGVWLLTDDDETLRCLSQWERPARWRSSGVELRAADFPRYFEAVTAGRAVDAEDARTDPRTAEFRSTYLEPNDIYSLLDATIRLDGRTVGVVCCESVGAPQRWRPDEVTFAGEAADQMALAIQRHELRQAEEERQQAEERLLQAQRLESIGLLTGGIAHDFNNLLLIMLGHIDLVTETLRGQAVDDTVLPDLDKVKAAADKATELTQQLMSFGQRQQLRPQSVDLFDRARAWTRFMRRLIPENIAMEVIARTASSTAYVDPSQLEQVLTNLCVNARDAMPGGGRIEIAIDAVDFASEGVVPEWASPRAYCVLSVSDTGTGIDPENLEHLFDPYFTTKERSRGTGLGLATVYGIARQHGGQVEVESQPEVGSTFRVYLPQATSAEPTREPATARIVLGGDETLLLAEDADAVRSLTARVLRGAGYRVLEATNGREAVETFDRNAAETRLVVLDVIMPELGGVDAARRIRAVAPGMPLLFTSGYSEPGVLDETSWSQTAHLQKPFDARDLLRAVRGLLDEAAEESA